MAMLYAWLPAVSSSTNAAVSTRSESGGARNAARTFVAVNASGTYETPKVQFSFTSP